MRKVVCKKNGSRARYFTDGKIYEFKPIPGTNRGHVVDDQGCERLIVPGVPSPHLKLYPTNNGFHTWSNGKTEGVGVFELVTEAA